METWSTGTSKLRPSSGGAGTKRSGGPLLSWSFPSLCGRPMGRVSTVISGRVKPSSWNVALRSRRPQVWRGVSRRAFHFARRSGRRDRIPGLCQRHHPASPKRGVPEAASPRGRGAPSCHEPGGRNPVPRRDVAALPGLGVRIDRLARRPWLSAHPGDPPTLAPTAFWHGDLAEYAQLRAATEASPFTAGEGLPGRIWRKREPE